ncbi:hypothetical protein [Hyphococcus sp.]|uniref:hypothetical protein n=1 Tax=Hyphococcus sp. TaxID=2038636 RepID=UPI00208C5C0E|nr:MAG: hypothetical protein DHS20C04_21310 [Marinicaulis sp.]
MQKIFLVAAAAMMLASCATAARYTLQDRFRAIGIPADTADCMVDELDDRLSNEDLQDLARYTVNVARADSTLAAIRALMKIDNPRAVTAIGASGVSCVTGLRL